MTSLIKSEDAHKTTGIRPIRTGFISDDLQSGPLYKASTAVHPVAQELYETRLENDKLIQELEAAVSSAEAKILEAEKRGAAAALAKFEHNEAERLESLKEGLGHAVTSLNTRLGEMEALSLLVAQTALERIFGHGNGYAEKVSAMVSHQMSRLGDSAVLKIEVSALDFPNEERLAAVSAGWGLASTDIAVRHDLAEGDCLLTVRFGQIELSLDSYWVELRDYFRSVSREME